MTTHASISASSPAISKAALSISIISICVRDTSWNAKKHGLHFSAVRAFLSLIFLFLVCGGGIRQEVSFVPPILSRTYYHPYSSWSCYCTLRWLPTVFLRIRLASLFTKSSDRSIRLDFIISSRPHRLSLQLFCYIR